MGGAHDSLSTAGSGAIQDHSRHATPANVHRQHLCVLLLVGSPRIPYYLHVTLSDKLLSANGRHPQFVTDQPGACFTIVLPTSTSSQQFNAGTTLVGTDSTLNILKFLNPHSLNPRKTASAAAIMSGQIAALEEDRQQYQEQLDVVLAGLKDDPENAELKNLQAELNDMISLLNESLAELQPKQAPKPVPQKAPSPPEPEKWSKENHPAFKKAAPAPEEKEEPPVTYSVNDTVMAKWASGDRGFYPARITSITGSSTDPVYIVKFKSYDNTETLRAKDIRPMSNKRKADGAPAPTSSTAQQTARPPGPSNGVVTSAAASLYPEQQAKIEAEKNAADGAAKPPKAKKIKATRELEKGKSKWQEFNSKSKFGKHKKDSMFRTPDGVGGRVGFTGSGQAMRKDTARSRHVYQQNDELD
ncbi:hypothetical protein CSIM01_06841 [Colletotrichum simmondsii]|uniref:Tudor domain-containing protein n=1 Tax=Colletotrichum simmondsii TaxID=703756 RepID=A0A135TF57_9PEZI|nr:hypothetical protein CSIM01_06841 [Colletotrichum simmondsii]